MFARQGLPSQQKTRIVLTLMNVALKLTAAPKTTITVKTTLGRLAVCVKLVIIGYQIRKIVLTSMNVEPKMIIALVLMTHVRIQQVVLFAHVTKDLRGPNKVLTAPISTNATLLARTAV